jgi:hypothetical protein
VRPLEPEDHTQQAKTDAEGESYKAIDRHVDSGNVVITTEGYN